MKLKTAIAVSVLIISTLAALSISGYGINSFFAKAFDVSLSAGESYNRNITVRKFYNLTVRFQKEGSTSYLSFDDTDAVIVLKAANGSVIKNLTGIENGRYYIMAEKDEIYAVATASAFSISNYADLIDQPVNFSFSGSSAYMTITVSYRAASIEGYVVDDLTGEYVDGVQVYAFSDGSNPQTAVAVVQNTSANGKYTLVLGLNSTMPLDVYAKDYDVV